MNGLKVAGVAAFLFIAALDRRAEATVYYFDATTGGVPGTPVFGVAVDTPIGIRFGGGYSTPLFDFPLGQFQPGDMISFGSVALRPSGTSCDQYGHCSVLSGYIDLDWPSGSIGDVLEPTAFLAGCFVTNASCDATLSAAFETGEASPIIVPLIFTVGTGTTTIEMAWAFGDYMPPPELSSAPLPAAFPLFAAGLGVMGLFGWRSTRSRRYACSN